MPCYAKNPVLLYTSDCRRMVCVHCRIDFRPSTLIDVESSACGEVLRNALPPAAVPAPRAGGWSVADRNPRGC
jgi:hypothetical protein